MIFYLISFIIIVYAFVNYKKAFLWYLIFKLFLVANVTLLSLPGIPFLKASFVLNLIFVALAFKKKIRPSTPFPYKKPLTFVMISSFLSALFSVAGIGSEISRYIENLCNDALFIWLMWVLIEEDDYRWLFKHMLVAFLFICLYGIFEKITHSNPLNDYTSSMVVDESRAIDYVYDEDSGRGYRVKSVFEHAIGAGLNWGLAVIMFFTYTVKSKKSLTENTLAKIVIGLSTLCILYTNSRGPIVFLLLCLPLLVNLKSPKFYTTATIFILLTALFSFMYPEYVMNVLSIFNSSKVDVGGSSAVMRFDQFDAAFALFTDAPIFGLGYKFMTVLHNSMTIRLLGLESIWLSIITRFGLVGVIANLYLLYYSIVKIPIMFKSREVFFLALAYWVTASMTSLPGFCIWLYYLIIFWFIKQTPNYTQRI